MVRQTVNNFPVGSFVEIDCSMNKSKVEAIGTVVGVTINVTGEPILMVHMIRRTDMGKSLAYLGNKVASHDLTGTIWEKTGPMHPNNVQMLNSGTVLQVSDGQTA
jgi:hypothetical protein